MSKKKLYKMLEDFWYDDNQEADVHKGIEYTLSAILSVFKEMVERAEPETVDLNGFTEGHGKGGECHMIEKARNSAIATYKANLLKEMGEL